MRQWVGEIVEPEKIIHVGTLHGAIDCPSMVGSFGQITRRAAERFIQCPGNTEHRVAPRLGVQPSAIHPAQPTVVRVVALLRLVCRAGLLISRREQDFAMQPAERQ